MPRRFSIRQRLALYQLAGGRCEECEAELGDDWHADHTQAYSRGGATDIINGRALCARCNRKKGAADASCPAPLASPPRVKWRVNGRSRSRSFKLKRDATAFDTKLKRDRSLGIDLARELNRSQVTLDEGPDHHRFVGGGTIKNTGNIGIKVRVTYKWQLLGESPLKLQRTYRVRPDVSRDISVSMPATGEQIDAHQSADGKCSSKAKITGTYGTPQT